MRSSQCSDHADYQTHENKLSGIAQNHADDVTPLRANRHTEADLLGLARDRE